MGYKASYEIRRNILTVLADGRDLRDIKGNFVRNEEYMNPKQIQDELYEHFTMKPGRDKITSVLDECYEHEKKFVVRRSKKDEENISKKRDFVEPKSQREYCITNNGKNLLEFMNSSEFEFASKRI